MTISSSQAEAALAAAEAAYTENADYDTYPNAAGVTKAKAFAAACRRILQLQPQTAQKGPNAVSYRVDLLADQIKAARDFVLAYSPADRPGKRVTYADFSDFRRA